MIFQSLWSTVYFYIRPLIKWFLHRFTRLSELQRICYGEPKGAPRSMAAEESIQLSRNKQIVEMIKSLDEICDSSYLTDEEFRQQVVQSAVRTVMRAKRIKPSTNPDFPRLFGNCVAHIWSYKRLISILEQVRKVPYNSDELDHEEKLFELWRLLMPHTKLESRITKQWQDIGFQGDDPKTDFRGMGMLGLENLLFFAREYNTAALHVLSHSMHPVHGYTFAIVGINITFLAYKLVKCGAAKTYIFNSTEHISTLNTFHKFYCYLFFEFDRYWMSCKPTSLMEFNNIHEQFQLNLMNDLADKHKVFKLNFNELESI